MASASLSKEGKETNEDERPVSSSGKSHDKSDSSSSISSDDDPDDDDDDSEEDVTESHINMREKLRSSTANIDKI